MSILRVYVDTSVIGGCLDEEFAVPSRAFDCIKIKQEIQTALRRKYTGLTDTVRRSAMEGELAASDAPISRMWRELTARQPVQHVAEEKAAYGTGSTKKREA